jgi:hypothetical protein
MVIILFFLPANGQSQDEPSLHTFSVPATHSVHSFLETAIPADIFAMTEKVKKTGRLPSPWGKLQHPRDNGLSCLVLFIQFLFFFPFN